MKRVIVWRNVIGMICLHAIAIYGLYLWLICWQCKWQTIIFQTFWAIAASFGITGGAHRLWTHRSYRARTPLRVLYAALTTMIFANDIYTWARDHRAHHKFTETDADPHNARRGFFFAHCGWLIVRRHPEVLRQGARISCADLEADAIVRFQRKWYILLMPIGTFILPTLISVHMWHQPHAYIFTVLRYVINIHIVWSLNSFAHLFGTRPYDKRIEARENPVLMRLCIGEGFHNYHHVFPWDYRAAELGPEGRSLTTWLIDMFARIGWAYDRRTTTVAAVQHKVAKYGDGSNTNTEGAAGVHDDGGTYWGWDDPDVTTTIKQTTCVYS